MYRILAGNQYIHDPQEELDGRVVISPVLSRQINKQGSLTFNIAPTNPLYNSLTPRLSYVSVNDDNGEIWRGRVIAMDRGWNNVRTVYCEGELSYLQDSMRYPFLFRGTRKQLFSQLIYYHNHQVDAARQFVLDDAGITINDTTQITVCTESAMSIWDIIDAHILNHGYILTYRNGNDIKIKCVSEADMNHEAAQHVQFGVNMLDLKQSVNASNVITRLIPYGGLLEPDQPGYIENKPETPGVWDANRLTIATATGQGGTLFIKNDTAEAIWGVVTGTAVFDSITVNGTTQADVDAAANRLLSAAQGELTRRIGESISVDVSAIDLSMVNPSVEPFQIGDYIWAESEFHDVKIRLICKKSTLYLTQPDKNVFSLGAGFKTLTDLSGATIVND